MRKDIEPKFDIGELLIFAYVMFVLVRYNMSVHNELPDVV